MHWFRSIDATAPGYPAVWMVETSQRPRNLSERSRLRQATALTLLSRQLCLPETEVAIAHDRAGQPRLETADIAGLSISLATRAGIVAVALARRPVGVDVELVDPKGGVPRGTLHRAELQMLDALAPASRPLAFARLWAAKEAYVKALGTGFVRPPESFAVSLLSGTAFRVDDPLRGSPANGEIRTIENGGQDVLAAAAIVLDRA